MGLFKGIKDMKTMVAAAPGMIDQANLMAAQSRQLADAQQQQAMAVAQTQGVAPMAGEDVFAPIANVTMEQYVAVTKGIAAYNYDQTMLPMVAAQHGIDRARWDLAAAGFNARVTASSAFAQRFNRLYRQG